MDNLDDVISVKFIQEIIDWCGSHPVIARVSDTSRVYLCGHSRVRLDTGTWGNSDVFHHMALEPNIWSVALNLPVADKQLE